MISFFFLNSLYFEFNFRYITDSNHLFSESCTIVTAVTTLSVTFSLFLVVTDSWIGGYAVAFPFTVQLFINSLIGMIATIEVWASFQNNHWIPIWCDFLQNDKLNKDIWKFPSYLLPVQDQKDYRFFMQHAMISHDMRLLFIGKLNFDLFISVWVGFI